MAKMILVGGPFDGQVKQSQFDNPSSTSITGEGRIDFYHSKTDWGTMQKKRDAAGRVLMFYSDRKPEAAK